MMHCTGSWSLTNGKQSNGTQKILFITKKSKEEYQHKHQLHFCAKLSYLIIFTDSKSAKLALCSFTNLL